MEDRVKQIISSHKVVIFSKTYCPYCVQVKQLFKSLNADAYELELDEMDEGAALHAAVKKIAGISTVPVVFINGKFIGGCDDCHKLHQKGKLVPLIQAEA